jgi:DNA replication protein DnaC
MNIHTEPSYEELMAFTDGKFETMTQEVQKKVYDECVRLLERRRLELSWKYLCPPGYRNTIPEQLPKLPKFEEVQKWKYGPTGLLLVGPTRRGKTRSVWKLLERLHFDERLRIIAFTPMDLKLKVASAWQEPAAAEDWIYDLRLVEVLFLDDLDTVKFTEAVEETIYDVFEWRPTHGKPVIATVNRTGPELAARMNASGRGAKIVERMREYCHVINFT